MRTRHFLGSVIVLASLPLFFGCGGTQETPADLSPDGLVVPTIVPGTTSLPLVQPNPYEGVVVFDAGTEVQDIEDIAAEFQIEILDMVVRPVGAIVRFGGVEHDDYEELRMADGVAGADPNLAVQIGESQTLILGFLEGEWSQTRIQEQAWIADLGLSDLHRQGKNGDGVVVAMLDTGADLDHPALVGKVQSVPQSSGFGSEELLDDVDDDQDGLFSECYGHGTHVAGCVATVAPGATLLPIRVMNDDGTGSLWDIVRGIDWARDYGVDIINLSLSVLEFNQTMEAALQKCEADDIAVLAAAGNGGNRYPRYPATSSYVAGVASVDASNYLSTFSGGGDRIPLAAPGETISSSYPGGLMCQATGTSMASPIAAGCVALVMQATGAAPTTALHMVVANTVDITPVIGVNSGRVAPVLVFE
ncbi:MAG: S8 family serine peptidase [Candidatus Eisenbacteria bacterium]|nr:S8 family serine peptidase [Candidatus Eisenbacteria bacterium]